ncbi:MAG: NAD(P)/FAD-dependent oxidoreductase [Spirochaetaceae bacterium]|nr:NAD(P)/FAD-dependent oxidoreductase [Spirochaetaceae bacterium]
MTQHECIVVGGGIAGLTAAVYLAKAGKKTLLLEKNERCGGLMTSFVREGFHFEGGARALVNSGLVGPMLEELGIDLRLLPNPVSLGIEDRLFPVRGEESLGDYARVLKELYPESVAEIDALFREIAEVIKDLKVLYGVDNPLFSKTPRNLAMLPGMLKWLGQFVHTISRIKKLSIPMERFFSSFMTNQALIDVFSQHFFRGTPAFFTLSYFALYNDYRYPEGGMGAFTQRLADRIRDFGGMVLTGTEVVRVLSGRRMLEDARGNQYGYENLIWAADLKRLYSIIDTGELPSGARAAVQKEQARILAARGAESVFTLYVALDEPVEALSSIPTGHLFYTPSRKGLGSTVKSELRAMLDHWTSTTREQVQAWLRDFCALNTFEISIPAMRDASLAPPGKTGLIISLLADYELFKKVAADGWYQELKQYLEDAIIEVLSRTLLPSLRDRILFRFSASPLTLARIDGSSEGAIVGWSFEHPLPVPSSMLQMNKSVQTTIPHVFKAGQWSFSPAGGPTAIMTGRLAAKMVGKG